MSKEGRGLMFKILVVVALLLIQAQVSVMIYIQDTSLDIDDLHSQALIDLNTAVLFILTGESSNIPTKDITTFDYNGNEVYYE